MEVLQLRAAHNSSAVAATYDPTQDTALLSTTMASANLQDTPDSTSVPAATTGPEPVLPPYVPHRLGEPLATLDESEDEGTDILEHVGKPPSFSVSTFVFCSFSKC